MLRGLLVLSLVILSAPAVADKRDACTKLERYVQTTQRQFGSLKQVREEDAKRYKAYDQKYFAQMKDDHPQVRDFRDIGKDSRSAYENIFRGQSSFFLRDTEGALKELCR